MKATTVGRIGRDEGVKVDRSTSYGNPFAMQDKSEAERTRVIAQYEAWLGARLHDEDFARSLLELRGKRLLCWCKPAACHADVIADLLNDYERSMGRL